jgi:hypothetical protein
MNLVVTEKEGHDQFAKAPFAIQKPLDSESGVLKKVSSKSIVQVLKLVARL